MKECIVPFTYIKVVLSVGMRALGMQILGKWIFLVKNAIDRYCIFHFIYYSLRFKWQSASIFLSSTKDVLKLEKISIYTYSVLVLII